MIDILGITNLLKDPIMQVLDKVIEDKDERNRIAAEISTLAARQAHEIQLGQIKVNAIEASSEKWWKAGWRPFIGWVCGSAMAFNYILVPVIGIWFTLPVLDITTMFPVLMGLLGLGGLRTIEKHKLIK